MADAQALHQDRVYDTAIVNWESAVERAPNQSERGRALRGQAASTWRANPDNFQEALVLAEEAQTIHANLCGPAGALSKPPEVVRQCVESERVVGRMLLHRAVAVELSGNPDDAELLYQRALPCFGAAFAAIRDLRQAVGHVDQHEINAMPDIAIGRSLATRTYDPALATISGFRLAARAVSIAPRSESGPTGARLGSKHHLKAVAVSSIRAGAALTISGLATKRPSSRRTRALQIASKVL